MDLGGVVYIVVGLLIMALILIIPYLIYRGIKTIKRENLSKKKK